MFTAFLLALHLLLVDGRKDDRRRGDPEADVAPTANDHMGWIFERNKLVAHQRSSETYTQKKKPSNLI